MRATDLTSPLPTIPLLHILVLIILVNGDGGFVKPFAVVTRGTGRDRRGSVPTTVSSA